jgi:hypothetical protein
MGCSKEHPYGAKTGKRPMLSGMIRMASARRRLKIGFNRYVPSLSIAFAIGVPGQFPFLFQKLGTRQHVNLV